MAKETGVHILALTHNKKVATENVFDSLLGSTAIRAETDCNIALYEQDQQRIIETEVRRGRKIEATIIQAKIVSSPLDGAEVVANFELMTRLDELKSTQSERSNVTQQVSYEEKVIRYLQGCTDQSSSQATILDNILGRRANVLEAVKRLQATNVLTVTGTKHSPNDPLTLHLDKTAIPMHSFITINGGRI